MTPAALSGYLMVPLSGVMLCAAPAVTRPTLQFGIRVPPAHVSAPVIARQRHVYHWRTAAVAACATTALIASQGYGSWWLPRIILLLEVTADVCCFLLARKKVAAVKTAEAWFARLRQTVVADTSWRSRPEPYPVRWLIPAATVIAGTAIIGIARYRHLPAHLALGLGVTGGHPVLKSPVAAFAIVIGQLYVTGVWSGLLVLVYHSRPDIDTAAPAASLRQYRKLLTTYTRAALTMLALIDVTLLLAALQQWRVYQLSGSAGAAVLLAPFAAGLLTLVIVVVRAGRQRVRAAGVRPLFAQRACADRDDDRFWKGGLVYVNHGDAAIVVPARFGIGWTFNFGNPAAWLAIGGIIATGVGLALLRIAAGM
jgi:uncharacterized membrane protein